MRAARALLAVITLIALSFNSALVANAQLAPETLKILGARTALTDPTQVVLDADLYLPTELPAPAVVLAHGFGGTKNSSAAFAKQLQTAGYVVLTYTARGFGNSTGSISMNSKEFEIADAQKIIDFLTTRAEVKLDSATDPVVGFAGGSYGGALSLMVAGIDSRVDAVSTDITWHNLETALFPQSAVGINSPGVYKELWTGYFFTRGLTSPTSAVTRCGRFAQNWCDLYESVAQSGNYTTEQAKLLQQASPISTNSTLSAPTLLMAGQADSLFPLSEAAANYQQIRTAKPQLPLKMIWHSGGHDGGTNESERLNLLTLNWFDTYLAKTSDTNSDFEVTFDAGNIISSDSGENTSRIETAATFSGLAAKNNSFALLGSPQQIIAPPGGVPAAISTFPGLGNAGGFLTQLVPGQFAVFQTPPLTETQKIIGSSQLLLSISSELPRQDAVLFASLRIVSAAGVERLPSGLVAPIKLPQITNTPTNVLINLPAIVAEAKAGDSIRVVISTTDIAYRLPIDAGLYTISLAKPELIVATETLLPSDLGNTLWIYLWVVLAALAISLLLLWVTRPKQKLENSKAELTSSPVAIFNLVKEFKNGPRAVDDISYEIPSGKVVGLLGPNGAGKTTTMRMIMGLIKPTSGSVYVFGEEVRPGAKVLARIGSLVEGSGFLPHLTGRQNLELYWKASGRSETANFDEVLEIADLGTAINRKVRTYSQGMRQRLGIAQAMLGMPDLLMLDEPTNGLDPQQIKAMREILQKYADAGKTVIISSHMLSEVEQTCSYVVVMHRGRLITMGEVADLLTDNMRLEDFFIDAVGDDLTIGKS